MRTAAVAFAVTVATLFATASAHASLVTMEPAVDTIVSEPPAIVALVFDEPIEVRFATLEVNALNTEIAGEPDFLRLNGLAAARVEELLNDDDADRVDTGRAGDETRSERIELALQPDLPSGAYVAAWRVLSVDGHPVQGHAVFVVAGAGADDAADAN